MSDNPDVNGEEVNKLNSLVSNAGNPLLNSLVASILFDLVNVSEIRHLRRVCKEWYFATLSTWRNTTQITIYDESSDEQHLQLKSAGEQLDLLAGEKPFRNFRLQSPRFISSHGRPAKPSYSHPRIMDMDPVDCDLVCRDMGQFWSNYGHWMHKLELTKVYVTDVEAFKRAIFEQTPNLQELTLERIIDGRGTLSAQLNDEQPEQGGVDQLQPNLKVFVMKNNSELLFGWKHFFARFPNIEKLEVSELEARFRGLHRYELVESVENMLRHPGRRPNLPITDLRFESFLARAVQRLLRMPLMKLKVLHLRLYGDTRDDSDVLRTAMQFHGSTLTKLQLKMDGICPIDLWAYQGDPYLSMTELQIKGSAIASNLHFLNKFPNLMILRLEQSLCDDVLRNTNWASLDILTHLREFYFLVTKSIKPKEAVLSEEILNRFGDLMPNLESFAGQLTNQTLRVVCRNWRKLKKLVILSGQCLDVFDTDDLPFLRFVMDVDDVGITGIVPGSDERVPCVADLQELCHLTLEHATLIGDASVFDGFLKLTHLSSLDICATNQICCDGLEALILRLQNGLTVTPLCGTTCAHRKLENFYT